ncbi:hypothetical protein W97_08952 [Coniosporium apollinis CBS 100218]|uniref:HNH nuclease domain-containing protein n=1 Tax=Coniosporium apollinis (strain CBS 100218) TaxID=1168221 RepID=R7Z6A3_CONA1|nr:uncharacterized protein W97_08952 [Coniosporium apollinis CBS 100218]EON69692.1 hypothetical protein W97_08952 [Coniosporium apollinis CBS 100218]
MLPPPVHSPTNTSGSSLSGRKRKRQEASPGSSIYAVSSASSEFSLTVKKKVARITDDETCWHCGARPTDLCHVIGKKDREFPQLVQQGLMTFDHLGDIDNAIPLCPTCHRNFDDINKPGLIFLPSDLRYFIDFEKEDFRCRESRARDTGSIPKRTCPTPQMYLEHQIRNGIVKEQEGTLGGLYLRYTLYDYFPRLGQSSAWIPGLRPFQEPESWHGAPMAAIWRASLILGNPLCGIPFKEARLLGELRDLYKRKISVSTTGTGAAVGGDREGGERQEDHLGPGTHTDTLNRVGQAQARGGDITTPTGDTQRLSGEDLNARGGADAWGSTVDSAIDLASDSSKRRGQEPKPSKDYASRQTIKPSGTPPKQRFIKSCDVTPQQQPQIRSQTQAEPSFDLPRHRPRPHYTPKQLWKWGPLSSSRDKVSHFTRMTGWIKD